MTYQLSDCSDSYFFFSRFNILLGFLFLFGNNVHASFTTLTENKFASNIGTTKKASLTHTTFATTALPRIDGFSTTKVQAGDNLTIFGSNFNIDPFKNIVRIGGIEAIVEDGSSTELTVTVPHGCSTLAEVVVLDIDTQLAASSFNNSTPVLKVSFNEGEIIQDHTFIEDQKFFSGSPAKVVSNADLNADGFNDLFFSIEGFIGIAYRNAENTGFLNAEYITTSYNYDKLIAKDLDNDGLLDIAGIDFGSEKISVFYRDFDNAGFNTFIELEALPSPSDLQSFDMNGDGYNDLLVTGSGQFGILYRNAENSDYELPIFYGPGPGTSHISVSDFNNDGKLDIAVSLEQAIDNINIFLQNTENNDFTLTNKYTAGDSPTELVHADLDHDGIEDLVALNIFQNTFTTLQGFTEGSFAVKESVTTPNFPYALHIADMNGDDNTDVVLLSISSGEFTVFAGDGALNFSAPILELAGSAPEWLTVGDLDHDGKPDIAVNNTGEETIGIHYYKPPPINLNTITPAPNAINITKEQEINFEFSRDIDPISIDNTSIVIKGKLSGTKLNSDFSVVNNTISINPNGIGQDFIPGEKVMLSLTNSITGTEQEIFEGTGGTFYTVGTSSSQGSFLDGGNINIGSSNVDFASADFNGDFISDFAIINNGDSKLIIYLNNNDGTFVQHNTYTIASNPSSIVVIDFNNDSFNDVAIADNTDETVKMYSNDGSGDFSQFFQITLPIGFKASEIKTADFNSDGFEDLLIGNTEGPEFIIYEGLEDGTFTFWNSFNSGTTFINQIDIHDVDGDGLFDIVVNPGDTDDFEIFLQQSGTFISNQQIPNEANITTISQLKLQDFNNDNFPDLIYSDPGNSAIHIHLNVGDGTFGIRNSYDISSPNDFTCNDFNGDGFQDIITISTLDNTANVFLGLGDGTLDLPVSYTTGEQPIKIIELPIDSDDDLDILTLNNVNHDISILLNDAEAEINLTSVNLPASNIIRGTTNEIIFQFTADISKDNTILENLSIPSSGTYLNTDIGLGGFKLFFNTNNDFTLATELSNYNTSTGNGETISFTSIHKQLNIGSTYHFWITVDISPTAAVDNTIQINDLWFTNINFSEGTKTGSDPLLSNAVFTIKPNGKPEPSEHATVFTATQNGSSGIDISWLDAGGIQPPDYYLLLGKKSGSTFPAVVDFSPIADDTDWTDGVVAINLMHTGFTSFYSFTELADNETYEFVVYPYTNTDLDVNYKTDNPPTATVSIFNPPSLQATNVNITNKSSTSISIDWVNGSGTSRIVVISEGNNVEGEPVNFNTYSANSNFGSGDVLDLNDYVVYNGTGNSVTVTGLYPSSQYSFKVFEYNGIAGLEKYLTTSDTENPNDEFTFATEPTQQAENLAFPTFFPTSVTLSYNHPTTIPDGYIILRGNGTETPIDGTNYTIGQVIGENTVVYIGNENVLTDESLTPGTSYQYQIFSYNGSGSSINYLQLNPLTGNITLPATSPNVQASKILFTSLGSNSLKLNWINGDGTQRLVLMKESSAINATPVDQITYDASSSFGMGDQIGTGNYVVYTGAGNSVTVSGLNAETQYFVQVFEFNGTTDTENYLTANALQNPASRLSIPILTNQRVISNASPNSASSAGMNIVSGTNTGDYLQDALDEITWGHNGLPADGTSTWAQGTVANRWERSWYVAKSDQKGNSDGQVKFVFDMSDAGSANTLDKNKNYFLIYSSDNTSNYSIVNYTSAYKLPIEDKIEFNLNALNLPEGYYTLGSTDGSPFAENALLFDGVDDFVQIGNQLSVPNSFTIEAWINVDDVFTKNPIISKGIDDSNESFLLMVDQGKLIFDWGGNTAKIISNRNLESGKWYHVAGVYDQATSTASIYLNGLKVGETSTADSHTELSTNSYIGKNNLEFFKGKIDELRIWNSARTQQEIRENNHEHIHGNETGLIAYYRFDKYEGNFLPDLSISSFGGILGGSMTAANWIASDAMVAPILSFDAFNNAETVAQGKRNHVFYQLAITPSQEDAFFEGLRLQMGGTYLTSDLDSVSLYLSLDQVLDTADDDLLQRVQVPPTGNYLQFNELNTNPKFNKDATYYLLIASNISQSATLGNTFNINAPLASDIYTSSGNSVAGIVANGGEKTIISPFVVTNTNDNGKGSLRWAMNNSNNSSDKTISFNLSGTGPWTINLVSELPQITTPTTIDASTQPNWNITNRIRINGQNNLNNGISIYSANTQIHGLTIHSFTTGILVDGDGQDGFVIGDSGKGNNVRNCQTGIWIKGADNGFIFGNRIGTNPEGSLSSPNTLYGIHVQDDASGIRIGSVETGKGNLIAGNAEANIFIQNAGNNFIENNIIGTNFLQNTSLGGKKGIWIDALSSNNTIGGTNNSQANLIGGHTEYGLFVEGNSNVISRNLIGTDNSFTNNLGNGVAGIYINGSGNLAGGTTLEQGNVLLNNQAAIIVDGSTAINNNLRFNRTFCNTSGIQLNNLGNNQVISPILNYANGSTVQGSTSPAYIVDIFTDSLDSCTPKQGKFYIGSTIADASGNFSFTGSFSEGHQITAQVTDANGNTSDFSNLELVDATAPNIPVITSITNDSNISNDFITNDSTLLVSGTGDPNSEVHLLIDNSQVGIITVDATGNWTLDIISTVLTSGSYSLTAKAIDNSLNESEISTAITLQIDAVAPDAPTITSITNDTGVSNDGVTADNTLMVSGSAESNASVYLYIDGNIQDTTTTDATGAYIFDLTSTPLASGTYNLSVKAKDIAGNISTESTVFSLVIDTSTPNTPIINDLSEDTDVVGDNITQDSTLIFSGTGDPNLFVELFLNSNSIGETTIQADGTWLFDYSANAISEGNYQLTAVVRNLAGTTGPVSEAFNFTHIKKPANQASNLALANIQSNSAAINWQQGSGNGELVVVFPADHPITLPEENTRYTANSDLALANSLGNGKIVFSNNTNSFEVTGLLPATKYKVVAFSYNDIGSYITYQTDTATNILHFETFAAEPINPPNGLILTEIQEDTITFSFLPSVQDCDGYLVVRRELTATLPNDGSTYQVGEILGNQLISFSGSEVSFVQTSLQPLTTYYYDIYAFNGDGNNINYLQSAPLTHEITTPEAQPSSQAQNLQLNALNSSTVEGTFDPANSSADGYLVLYTDQNTNNPNISDGTSYFEGENLDGWIVLQQSNNTTFLAENLILNSNYTFAVIAYNGSGNTTNYRFHDRLIGNVAIDNNAPTSITLSNLSFTENASIGTLVGTLSSTDIDVGDTHTYSFINNNLTTDSSAFRINGNRLEVNKTLFFVDNSSYHVSIESRDNNGGSLIQNFVISVKEIPLLSQDSTAALSLYQGLNPAPSFNENNLVKTWEGISVRGGRITGIDISSLGLDSISIASILLLDALDTLHLSNNRLTFQYLEPFSRNIANFSYLPQNITNETDTLIAFSNNGYTIAIEENTSNETYQWYKSGELLEGATSSSLLFNTPSKLNEGIYQCEIKSTVITDLTLYSKNFYLKIINVLNEQDSLSLVGVMQDLFNDKPNFDLNDPAANWPGVIEENNRVIELNFSNANLTGSLSEQIGNLTALTKIDFFNNNLEGEIPKEIGNLTNLTYLDLDQNNLTGDVPEEIGNLENLITLWLARNNFTSLPSSIGNLTQLEFLFVQENELKILPESLGQLQNLKILDASNNNLNGFIENVSGLVSLQELNLAENNIKNIYSDIGLLTSLKLLDLSNNSLTELPINFDSLPALEKLFIYNNYLTFEDIEPLDLAGNNYQLYYAPQKNLPTSEDVFASTNSSIDIDLSIGGTSNFYVWEKDGVVIDTTTLGTMNMPSLSLNDAGTYTARVYSNQVHNLEIKQKDINIFITCASSPNVEIKTEYDTTVCEGKNIYIELMADQVDKRKYSWRKDGQELLLANTEKYVAFDTGRYNLIITDSSGCSAKSNSIDIVSVPTPEVTVNMLDSTTMVAVSNATDHKFYRWYFNGQLIENAYDSILQASESGLYKASVENEFSCEGFSDEVSFVITAFEDNVLSNEIALFPNPAHNKLNIELPSTLSSAFAEIFNISGVKVKETLFKFEKNHVIDISDIPKGVYTVIINTDKGKAAKRFVKI